MLAALCLLTQVLECARMRPPVETCLQLMQSVPANVLLVCTTNHMKRNAIESANQTGIAITCMTNIAVLAPNIFHSNIYYLGRFQEYTHKTFLPQLCPQNKVGYG
eukprot:3650323-Amphidinium_carterae.1